MRFGVIGVMFSEFFFLLTRQRRRQCCSDTFGNRIFYREYVPKLLFEFVSPKLVTIYQTDQAHRYSYALTGFLDAAVQHGIYSLLPTCCNRVLLCGSVTAN